MHHLRHIALSTCAALALTGCVKPQPPPPDILERGIVEALIDTGLYAEVVVTRMIGQHFSSSENKWKVFACYEFVLANGAQGTSCVDSIGALRLHQGSWIVSVMIDDIYRWRAISVMPEPDQSPATPDAPSE